MLFLWANKIWQWKWEGGNKNERFTSWEHEFIYRWIESKDIKYES